MADGDKDFIEKSKARDDEEEEMNAIDEGELTHHTMKTREDEVKEYACVHDISCWHAAEEMVEGYVVTGTDNMLYEEVARCRHEELSRPKKESATGEATAGRTNRPATGRRKGRRVGPFPQ